jgi:hypothetical protein
MERLQENTSCRPTVGFSKGRLSDFSWPSSPWLLLSFSCCCLAICDLCLAFHTVQTRRSRQEAHLAQTKRSKRDGPHPVHRHSAQPPTKFELSGRGPLPNKQAEITCWLSVGFWLLVSALCPCLARCLLACSFGRHGLLACSFGRHRRQGSRSRNHLVSA